MLRDSNPLPLVSIDWDWVTGDCSSVEGHGCCGWCANPPRDEDHGLGESLAKGWEGRLDILHRIKPVDGYGHLWVVECHADILRIVDPSAIDRIIHLDSHMDDADWFGLSCGSWRTFLPKGIDSHLSTMEELAEARFRNVFVCKSSPWTPREMDSLLWDLVLHLSKAVGSGPEFIGHRWEEMMYDFQEFERQQRRPEAQAAGG
jgi:hypothetical protein